MSDRFAQAKEQILTQYIIHHAVDDAEVGILAERLERALVRAEAQHQGQRRKTGEDYIWHPLRTAMEVSRFGRIIDWASIEASLLHDTLEDTAYSFSDLQNEFPEATNLVLALTKIKDSRVHTYQKLFRFVLQDIRVLLVKIADRLDNLESLGVFKPEKQERIARESAEMYANICRRLCMLDLAERLSEKIGPILTPEQFAAFQAGQRKLREVLEKPLEDLRARLASIFPGDLAARIEVRWNRFDPNVAVAPENLLTIRVITQSTEDAYRALGRIHLSFNALPNSFQDTFSTPRKNGYRALETRVSHRGRIFSFYIASSPADRFNRLGLLSMDITSPEFNLEYMDDLRDFLQNEDMNIQDFLRFHRPDAIQVTSPRGEVFSLEEGVTALDFAFAVHEQLGLRAVKAKINDQEAPLATVLHPGDRVEIISTDAPAADSRYLGWATSRKALYSLRRYVKRREAERAAATGRQWYLDAAAAQGMEEDAAEALVRDRARQEQTDADEIYRGICLGDVEIANLLEADQSPGLRLPGGGLFKMLRRRGENRRRVRRYQFDQPHIRFCPGCSPVEGDEVEGIPERGRLVVHRPGCRLASGPTRLPLAWDKGQRGDLRDPGPVELEISLTNRPGVLFSLLAPFKDLGIEIEHLRLPDKDQVLTLRFEPGSARTLNRALRALRKDAGVRTIRVHPRPPAAAGKPRAGADAAADAAADDNPAPGP